MTNNTGMLGYNDGLVKLDGECYEWQAGSTDSGGLETSYLYLDTDKGRYVYGDPGFYFERDDKGATEPTQLTPNYYDKDWSEERAVAFAVTCHYEELDDA